MVSLDFANPMPYFLEHFDQVQFSPLSSNLLRVIFREGERHFPGTGAKYFGISGIIFLRGMVPELLDRCENKAVAQKAMQVLRNCFNMSQNAKESEAVLALRAIVDKKIEGRDDRPIRPRDPLTLGQMEMLVNFAAQDIPGFEDVLKDASFQTLYTEFTEICRIESKSD
jgi:hypothetical protein